MRQASQEQKDQARIGKSPITEQELQGRAVAHAKVWKQMLNHGFSKQPLKE